MDMQTRRERAALIKDLAVRIHDSRAGCRPLTAMWSAMFAGITMEKAIGATSAAAIAAIPAIPPPEGRGELLQPPWRHAPDWLGLNPESAQEMLLPDLTGTDWKAEADENGYVSLWAITKMLNAYGETGEVRWPTHEQDSIPWRTVCERNRINWAAWHSNPFQNWGQPGVEKVAIVTYEEGQEPGLSRYDIAQEFSRKAGCNVHIISPEQIPERRRQEELNRALVFYGHPH